MQFNAPFSFIAALVVSAIASLTSAALADAALNNTASNIVSEAQMMHWIATTDTELTFIGEPLNPLAVGAAQKTMITFCSNRAQNVCGGPCTVYNGGATCLAAPDTNCLKATKNVGFCSQSGCSGDCTELTSCIQLLDDGFCFTPGTNSIVVITA